MSFIIIVAPVSALGDRPGLLKKILGIRYACHQKQERNFQTK